MTGPHRVRQITIYAAIALVCALVVWLTRYEYIGAERGLVVRVNRWTGATAILTRSAWRPIAPAPASPAASPALDPLDSLRRKIGLPPASAR